MSWVITLAVVSEKDKDERPEVIYINPGNIKTVTWTGGAVRKGQIADVFRTKFPDTSERNRGVKIFYLKKQNIGWDKKLK